MAQAGSSASGMSDALTVPQGMGGRTVFRRGSNPLPTAPLRVPERQQRSLGCPSWFTQGVGCAWEPRCLSLTRAGFDGSYLCDVISMDAGEWSTRNML